MYRSVFNDMISIHSSSRTRLSISTHCMNEPMDVTLSDVSLMFAPLYANIWNLKANTFIDGMATYRCNTSMGLVNTVCKNDLEISILLCVINANRL